MEKFILTIDQGTTTSRAIIFDYRGEIIGFSQEKIGQVFPKPGWVEHDANEIFESQIQVTRDVINKAKIDIEQITSIGITNQRETVVMWERSTAKPVYNAIVWQCRRSSDICTAIKETGVKNIVREKTGLLLDPYFSATKIKWMFDNINGLYERAIKGEICFGTIDTWLLFNLTGEHYTEPTNASRTLLFNINTGDWDEELLQIFGIPREILPEIKPSCSFFGYTKKNLFGRELPITALAGDQQASLFGQACYDVGDAKNTYGTGCFALVNIGKKPVISKHNLLTTVAWDLGDGMEYALEGSVFVAGAVIKWLRDEVRLINKAEESEIMAKSVEDSGSVFVVPAFVGLGAPYWEPNVRGTILGITRGTTDAHIVRAALESIAFLSRDLIEALQEDFGKRISILKADGGASSNTFLMQFQADILGIPVIQSVLSETTALGAAFFSGLYSGFWKDKEEIKEIWRGKRKFIPNMGIIERKNKIENWAKAVEAIKHFKV